MFCRKLAVVFIDHEPEKKLQGPQGIVSIPRCSPVEHILCLEKNIKNILKKNNLHLKPACSKVLKEF